MTTQLILVSHGITQWNEEGRIQGHTDVPLNQCGKTMAQCLAKRLSSKNIHAIYTSDLKRAYQTGMPTAENKNFKIIQDIRLREGRCINQERSHTYPTLPFSKEVETEADLFLRMEAVLSEIAHSHDNQTVLVVSHGGALDVFIKKILENTNHKFLKYHGIRMALNQINYDDGLWYCVNLNENEFLT